MVILRVYVNFESFFYNLFTLTIRRYDSNESSSGMKCSTPSFVSESIALALIIWSSFGRDEAYLLIWAR